MAKKKPNPAPRPPAITRSTLTPPPKAAKVGSVGNTGNADNVAKANNSNKANHAANVLRSSSGSSSSLLPTIPPMAILAFCVAVTFVVFSNTFSAGFVNWDDHGYLWENKLIQPLSPSALYAMFTGSICGNYSPLVALTYSLEHIFDSGSTAAATTAGIPKTEGITALYHGFEPFLYHFDNVLLHVGTTALVFVLLRQLGLTGWGLALATILFGIHPMRVESVAWVTERKDVLYGLFYIAALITYWRYITRPDRRVLYYALTVLLGLLSYFSKIQAVALPLSMLALDYLAGRNVLPFLHTNTSNSAEEGTSGGSSWAGVWLEKLPFFVMSLVFGYVGIVFVGQAGGFEKTDYALWQRLFFGTYSLCVYVVRVLFPFALGAYYPYPKPDAIPFYYYLSPLPVLALVAWVLRTARAGRVVMFGFGFFFLNIFFLLQIQGAGKAFMADRFTYIPYLGFFYLMGYYFNRLESGEWMPQLKRALPAVSVAAAAFVGMCGVLTYLQNQTWQSSITLWDNVTHYYPNDALSWTNKGLAHFDHAEYENSIIAFDEASRADPTYYDAPYNKGVAYTRLKNNVAAAKAYTQALGAKPSSADGYYCRGLAYSSLEDWSHAAADYEKALQLGFTKDPAQLHRDLAAAYAGMKQFDRAMPEFEIALGMRKDPDFYYMKGNALAQGMGKYAEGIEEYDKALAIKPDLIDAVNNKANCLASLGRTKEALAMFDRAIQIQPNSANYYNNRAFAKNALGDKAGACADWQKAQSMGYQDAARAIAQFCK